MPQAPIPPSVCRRSPLGQRRIRHFKTQSPKERQAGGGSNPSRGFVERSGTGIRRMIAKRCRRHQKSDKVEYGFENGETLDVPDDWNSQSDRLFFYEERSELSTAHS
jgi:hypothetical protein